MPRKMPAISVGRMRIPAAIWWGRLATGAVFVLVGIYSSLRYIHEWI